MQNQDTEYDFRPVTEEDLGLLNHWIGLDHMTEWWDADPYTTKDLRDPRVNMWIVAQKGKPFAFMQDYDPHGWAGHYFGHLATGSRGVDQFIGVPDMLGRGHGVAFIAQRVRALFQAGAPCVATDPHPDNARAIAVYSKVGFEISGPAIESKWGRVLPMIVEASRFNPPAPPSE